MRADPGIFHLLATCSVKYVLGLSRAAVGSVEPAFTLGMPSVARRLGRLARDDIVMPRYFMI